MTAKDLVIEAALALPDDATFEVVLEEIAILAAIQRGVDDANAGRVVPHEEVKRRVARWLAKVIWAARPHRARAARRIDCK
jgi:predicted transcriptional regulator